MESIFLKRDVECKNPGDRFVREEGTYFSVKNLSKIYDGIFKVNGTYRGLVTMCNAQGCMLDIFCQGKNEHPTKKEFFTLFRKELRKKIKATTDPRFVFDYYKPGVLPESWKS